MFHSRTVQRRTEAYIKQAANQYSHGRMCSSRHEGLHAINPLTINLKMSVKNTLRCFLIELSKYLNPIEKLNCLKHGFLYYVALVTSHL